MHCKHFLWKLLGIFFLISNLLLLGSAETMSQIYRAAVAAVPAIAGIPAAIPAELFTIEPAGLSKASALLCTATLKMAKYSCELATSIACEP